MTNSSLRNGLEQQLQLSEARFRSLIEHISEGILILNRLTGQIVHANPYFLQLSGYNRDDLVGKPIGQVNLFENLAEPIQCNGAADKTVWGHFKNLPLRAKDGRIRHVEFSSSVYSSNGDQFVQCHIHDVTGRNRAERALREKEEQLRLLLDSTAEGIYGIDMEGACTFCNAAAVRMLGFTAPGDVLGKNMHNVDHHTRRDGTPYPIEECHIYKAFRRGAGTHVDDEVMWRADGTSFPVEYWSYPIQQDGAVMGAVVTFIDISERMRSKEELNLFRVLVDQSNDAVEVIDPETGRFLDASQTAYSRLGYTREEFLALSVPDIDPLVKREGWTARMASHRGLDSITVESQHRRKDGTVFPIEVNGKFVRLSRNYLVAFVRDITERKNAEVALRASEEGYRLLFESSRDALMTLGPPAWRFTSANRATLEMFGAATAADFTALGPWQVSPELQPDGGPSSEKALAMIAQAMRDGANFFEWEHRRLNGECFAADVLLTRMEVGGKNFLQATVRDITERKQANNALRTSEERFRQLAENINQVFWLVNPEMSEMYYVSPAYEKIWGRTASSLYARPTSFVEAIHPEDRERIDRAIATKSAVRVFDNEYRIIRPDGSIRWIHARAFPICNELNEVYRVAGLAQDITEHKEADKALKESERRHREMLENVQLIAAALDREGKITFCNDYFLGLTGWQRDEVLGTDWFEKFVPPEQQAEVKKYFLVMLANGLLPKQRENDIVTRQGERRNIVWNNTVVRDAKGQIIGATTIGVDITERKRAEQLVHLQTTGLEAAANGIMITDRSGKILWANPAFTSVTGYSLEEAVGQTPKLLKSGMQPESFYADLWHTISTGLVWEGEIINRRKDGSFYTEEMTITPVHAADGSISNFIAIKQDITERKRAEERIREQAAIIDQAHEAIIVRDVGNCIRHWNKGAERLYGWTAAEAIGKDIRQLLFKDGRDDLAAALRATLESGSWAGELHQINRSGEPVVVDSHWSVTRDAEGKPNAILAINTDITEKKGIERQLHRNQRLESIGILAGGIAHDLNNVLSPVLMAADLLKQPASDALRVSLADVVRSSAERGANLVKQILAFARGAEGPAVPVELTPIIKETHKLLEHSLPKSIAIEASVAPDLWLIPADGTQITQVLMNLCVNARDAMPGGGRLTIQAENATLDHDFVATHIDARAGSYVVLRVMDTGAGIPEAIRDKIFDPFFTTKDKSQGTGLGLATALGIVKGYGGFIDFTSEVNRGTCFSVYFPAIDLNIGAPSKLPERIASQGEQELILLADDEPAIRQLIQMVLEKYGYRVVTAQNGAEAIDVFAKHRSEVRLVILDMMMPVMDGPVAIRALREIDPEIPVIAMTGLIAECSGMMPALGVAALLRKPISSKTLLHEVKEVLQCKPCLS